MSKFEKVQVTREIALTAVLSATYAVAILLLIIPSPTGGYTHVGDFVVFMSALLFGHRVGGSVGVIGAVVVDLFTGYPRWFVSIPAHWLEGLIPGLTKNKSFAMQIIGCVVGGFLMATTYFLVNIYIKGIALAVVSYARDLFVQAGVSIVLALIVVKAAKKFLPQLN
ncbi:MAG: ECF transporter S component [Candidatus Bathyarchaeia archaeon]